MVVSLDFMGRNQ